MLKHNWSWLGVYYAITLIVVIGIVLFGAKFFQVNDPTWALISAIICTELDLNRTPSVVMQRIFLTIIGVVLALIMLLIFGIGYIALFAGTIFITLTCHYIIPLSNNWKLATATGMIVLLAASQQHSVKVAEIIGFTRSVEVVVGSVIAGVVSIISGQFWRIVNRNFH